jgi:glycosyltransferase involved in cell wall biosynthesis
MLDSPITVVIPAKNESGSISKVVHECRKVDKVHEVIVSDNNSSDDTALLARSAGARVVFCKRPGFGATLKTGFWAASTDWIFKIDADILNTNPQWLQEFVNIAKGYALISGQWEHDEQYWALTYYLIRPYVKLLIPELEHIQLLNSGMYLVNKNWVGLQNFSDGWGFDTMMHVQVHLAGGKIRPCQIDPVVDYLRPHAQYLRTAEDTLNIFETIRNDPRLTRTS